MSEEFVQVTMQADEWKWLADAHLAFVSHDDATPVIEGALVIIPDEATLADESSKPQMTVMSTDRFRAARTFSPASVSGRLERRRFIIPADALKWIGKNALSLQPRRESRKSTIAVRFTVPEDHSGGLMRITIASPNGEELARTMPCTVGEFPPIERLFPGSDEHFDGSPRPLRAEFLTKAAKLSHDKEPLITLKWMGTPVTLNTTGTPAIDKPKPGYIEFVDSAGRYADTVIQPVLTQEDVNRAREEATK